MRCEIKVEMDCPRTLILLSLVPSSIPVRKPITYNIQMPTIFMDGQCLNLYLSEGSAGLILNQIKSQN